MVLKTLGSKIFVTLALGLLLLVVVGAGSVITFGQYEKAAQARNVTFMVSLLLERLLSDLEFVEAGQRGFLLTEDVSYLMSYETGVARLPGTLKELKSTTLDPEVGRLLNSLDDPIEQKLADLEETLRLANGGQREVALERVRSGRGQELMVEIRRIVAEINRREEYLLERRNAQLSFAKSFSYGSIAGAIALAILLKSVALFVIYREIGERRLAQREAMDARDELQVQLELLNAHNRDVRRLSELTTLLHSCNNLEEAYQAIEQFAPQIFSGCRGGLFTYNASGDLVESVAAWGEDAGGLNVFPPSGCWALRTGQDYKSASETKLRCKHVGDYGGDYMCLPMLAQGDVVGMLHVAGYEERCAEDVEHLDRLVSTTADVIAPALVNLRLRESLRQQSIRDSLTGLYNRRFMEESFVRAISGASREGSSVAVMMIDLDHFKRLNDCYGHDAGDAVLAATGRLLLDGTRAEDICCRFGGEELLVILPGTNLQDAARRAEALREDVEKMRVERENATLSVTASFGVAAFPDHGTVTDRILRAADLALYRAKAEGRNRVCVAEVPVVGS